MIELPPLPSFPLSPETRRYAEIAAARERILQARIAEQDETLRHLGSACDKFRLRIAELEAALSDCVDLAEWWINHKREPRMCERDYMTWLAIGHSSDALLKAKAAIDAARST